MELDINGIIIRYDEFNFTHEYLDGTKVNYPNVKIHEVSIFNEERDGYTNLKTILETFNESNYNVVRTLFIPEELIAVSKQIFDVIFELKKRKKYILYKGLSDYFFERFTILWGYFSQHQRHILGTILWQHICKIVWDWEKENKGKTVHKGTPYFFLGANLLSQGNIDTAFLFIYNAIEEDKKFSKEYKKGDFYRNLPAFLFSSLIVDNPNNFLFPFVKNTAIMIESRIKSYNKTHKKSFSFTEFNKRFLKSSIIEKEKFFFIYSMNVIQNIGHIMINELQNNEFSKLKNLDNIFNLCLIIDNVIGKKIDKELGRNPKLISNRIKKLCSKKYSITEDECYRIFDSLDFKNNPKDAIKKCLDLNYSYNGEQVNKRVLNLILIWGLRNYGGHNIESDKILVENYEEILQLILNGLFVVLEDLY